MQFTSCGGLSKAPKDIQTNAKLLFLRTNDMQIQPFIFNVSQGSPLKVVNYEELSNFCTNKLQFLPYWSSMNTLSEFC